MKAAIVSDTSPLNYLVLIDAVDVLPRLFSSVIIPPAVASELSQPGTPEPVRRWLAHPPGWLDQQAPQNTSSVEGLDPGESEAISLAQELGINALLLDERKARHVAAGRGLIPIGTLAILEIASGHGWIDFDECIRRLRATSFRIHERLITEAGMRLKRKRP
jgi:predicted nucleic acid-binding protein